MKKWALALEGGSLRCMFSAGAVDVMMEQGLWSDGVFGVSAGALTGVNYVSRQVGRTAQVNLDYVNDKRYLGLGNLIFKKSIFNFDFLFGEISDKLIPLDRETFAASPTRFTAVATDCRTGQPVFWEKHSCQDIYGAIRASASMPLLAPTVEVEGIPCVDGGASLSIPYARALEEGYDKVVVITTREHGYRKPQTPRALARLYAKHYKQYPQLVRALLETPRRYARELDALDRLEAQGKVFVLRPPEPVTVSRTERDLIKLRALYAQGRQVCRNSWKHWPAIWKAEKEAPPGEPLFHFIFPILPKILAATKPMNTIGTTSSSTSSTTAIFTATPHAASMMQTSRERHTTAKTAGSSRSIPENVGARAGSFSRQRPIHQWNR